MEYETVVGLEVHAQLKTRAKMFCRCENAYFGHEPNTRICPVCLGLPGTLPVVNRRAIDYGLMVALALDCQIAAVTQFERKNYPYPDLVKGYQISQYQVPLGSQGCLEIEVEGRKKKIGINRVHLEEDTAKLLHDQAGGRFSLMDVNRAGVPLLEIVSEPDLRSAEEAVAYLYQLRDILRYLGVCTTNMEQGALRLEANVSVRPLGAQRLGTKCEVKNLNSFEAVGNAIRYEAARQGRLFEAGRGEELRQCTFGWDAEKQRTVFQRAKETAADYRYFPEPDLPPVEIAPEWLARVRAEMPELRPAKIARYQQKLGLPQPDALTLTEFPEKAAYFEKTAALTGNARTAANWVMRDLAKNLYDHHLAFEDCPVPPAALAELIGLVATGEINNLSGQKILTAMFAGSGRGQSPGTLADQMNLRILRDASAVEALCRQVIAENPRQAELSKSGKPGAVNWLVGQVMRQAKGKAQPQAVATVLERLLGLSPGTAAAAGERKKSKKTEKDRPAPDGSGAGERPPAEDLVSIEEFAALDLRTAEVVECARAPSDGDLLLLKVKLGEEWRQVAAELGGSYAPEALLGKTVILAANLVASATGEGGPEGKVLVVALGGGDNAVVTTDRETPGGLAVS